MGATSAEADTIRQMCLSCHAPHYAGRGGCPDCHRGNPASGRKNIAHAGLVEGKYARHTIGGTSYLSHANGITEMYSCRRCHIIDGRGNRLAANLDISADRKKPAELAASIRRPVDNMPDFRMNEEQVTVLVNNILAGSPANKPEAVVPTTVHFSNTKSKNADIFTRSCGACHRLLSERSGALGSGSIGPNLSGLLSTYYPKTFRGDQAWSFGDLTFWLKNPRESRSWARMRPVKLSDAEHYELESALKVMSNPKRR